MDENSVGSVSKRPSFMHPTPQCVTKDHQKDAIISWKAEKQRNGNKRKSIKHDKEVSGCTSYSFVFIWHHMSNVSLTVAAFRCSAGSVNENMGPLILELPVVVGVDGVLGDGELQCLLCSDFLSKDLRAANYSMRMS